MNLHDLSATVRAVKARAGQLGTACRIREPMECSQCGHIMPRADITTKCVLPARVTGPPEDCYPGDWVETCPECGADASFDPALVCAVCEGRPCRCEPDDDAALDYLEQT